MKKFALLILATLLTSCGDKDISIDIQEKFFYANYNIYPNNSDNYISFLLYADKIWKDKNSVDIRWYFMGEKNRSCYENMNVLIDGKILLPNKTEVEFKTTYNEPMVIARGQFDFSQGMEIIQAKNIRINACDNSYDLVEKNKSSLIDVSIEWLKFISK